MEPAGRCVWARACIIVVMYAWQVPRRHVCLPRGMRYAWHASQWHVRHVHQLHVVLFTGGVWTGPK
jgi:hypothetical protein